MSKIVKLSDLIIDRIKAGEIVDRPLSIVKELLENSLDAMSDEIIIEILDGGKSLIRITDNGMGMLPEDITLCFERHATSKITQVADIECLSSFGFRGEAIPSIASVSHCVIASRTSATDVGHERSLIFGENAKESPKAMPVGTQVSVSDLFGCIPVRLKFLKTTSTEFAHILDFAYAMALAYPSVGLTLKHNGKDVFRYPQSKTLHSRFAEVLGQESHEYFPIDFKRGSLHVTGFVGKPEFARSHSKLFVTFVNGRYVRDKVIRAGIAQAYSGLLMKGMFPNCVLFVNCDPSWVDVNVHPSKTEVRFHDAPVLQDLIAIGVQDRLKAQLSRQSQPNVPLFSRAVSVPLPIAPQAIATQTIARPATVNLNSQHTAQVKVSPKIEPPPELIVQTPGFFDNAQYIGQHLNCYLMLSLNTELYVIDQHAFHERILFEELTTHKPGALIRQSLLSPILVKLPAVAVCLMESNLHSFLKLGFEVEVLDSVTLAIHAYPSMIAMPHIQKMFDDIVSRILATEAKLTEDAHPVMRQAQVLRSQWLSQGFVPENLSADDVYRLHYATIACHSAVRSGDALPPETVRRLLARSKDVDFFTHCPHGRPVYRKFSQEDVGMWFGRE